MNLAATVLTLSSLGRGQGEGAVLSGSLPSGI